jgi:hypothetical protein
MYAIPPNISKMSSVFISPHQLPPLTTGFTPQALWRYSMPQKGFNVH